MKSKKILATVLALLLSISSLCVCASAIDYTPEWKTYYETLDGKLPLLSPGADESELYVTWHSLANAPAPVVKIAKDKLMTQEPREFVATTDTAETPELRVNRCLLTDLEPGTTYYYSYTLDNGTSAAAQDAAYSVPVSFRTGDADEFTVLFGTDTQIGSAADGPDKIMNDSYIWGNIITAAKNNHPEIDFIVHSGDETQTGVDAAEWHGVYAPSILRSLPIATIIGNHDKKGDMFKYYATYPNAYESVLSSDIGSDYWFAYDNAVFVVFDSTCGDAPTHYDVAKEAVQANPDAKWLIGVMHHDLYGSTDSAGTTESTILMKNIYEPIFDEFHFDVVLTGHSHSYGRSYQMYNGRPISETKGQSSVTDPKGTVYISGMCTGNKFDDYDNEPYEWTAFRYEERDYAYTYLSFSDEQLTIKTEKLDQELIDSYTIAKNQDSDRSDGSTLEKDAGYSIVKSLSSIYMMFDKAIGFLKSIFNK